MSFTDKKTAAKHNEVLDEDELELIPIPIAKLESDGVSVSYIKKLQENGYYTVESIAFAAQRAISQKTGIVYGKVCQICKIAAQRVGLGIDGKFWRRINKQKNKIKTGSKELDHVLGGGIETSSLTEIFGEFCTGKTQLCHTLAVTCQLPINQGGGDGKCLYIDTEGTFRPDRLLTIAERFGLRGTDVLDNITFAKAHNTDHQTNLLIMASSMMLETRYALMIVDSATSLYRTDFPGSSEMPARQLHMSNFLSKLKQFAFEHAVGVVVTNQVYHDIYGTNVNAINGIVPYGGSLMARAANKRLHFCKRDDNTRICKIYDSQSLPESEVAFAIARGGIVDIKNKVD